MTQRSHLYGLATVIVPERWWKTSRQGLPSCHLDWVLDVSECLGLCHMMSSGKIKDDDS